MASWNDPGRSVDDRVDALVADLTALNAPGLQLDLERTVEQIAGTPFPDDDDVVLRHLLRRSKHAPPEDPDRPPGVVFVQIDGVAEAVLRRALRSGDAGERAVAYNLLVSAARASRDPQVVAEVVTRLGRLRNEQDPVRGSALTRLAATAPLLTAETAAGLTRLTTDAVRQRRLTLELQESQP